MRAFYIVIHTILPSLYSFFRSTIPNSWLLIPHYTSYEKVFDYTVRGIFAVIEEEERGV